MIYTELTLKAMDIAYAAHHGQRDKAGMPYIFHPFWVAEQMDDEMTVCAALLHDVVEDTNVTLRQLEDVFPEEVTEIVRLLTHDKNVSYEDYLRAIALSPAARKIKLADISHNSDLNRLTAAGADNETIVRLQAKYEYALNVLNDI